MAALLPFRPMDGFYRSEDFFDNEAVADGTIGTLNWEIVTIANASTYATLVTTNTVSGRPGILRHTTAGTADGDGSVLRLDEDTVVLENKPGSFSFGIRLPSITGNILSGNDFRIGLGDSVTAADDTVGIWVGSVSGVLTLQADSADGGDTSQAFNHPDLTSNTTLALGDWMDCVVSWSGTNANGGPKDVLARASINNGGFHDAASINTCLIDNDEEMEFHIVQWQLTGGADTLEQDIDYIDLMIQGRG